jgi:methyltransferase-like protein
VSFNTLPGWSTRSVIRDLMRYHAAQFADPRARLKQARGIAELLAGSVTAANSGYESLVREEVEALRGARDDYVLHEYLEDINEPLYFHQFVDRVASHGLQYLADADFGTMLASNFPPDVAQALVRLAPGVIRQEQYMDFLRNRTFRQALLVHDAAPINRKIAPDRLRKLSFSGAFELQEGPSDLRSNDTVTFRGARGVAWRTAKPIARAAAAILNESWPCAVAFEELCRRASAILRDWAVPVSGADEAALAAELVRCFGAGTVQFHARASPYAAVPGDRPTASPLARLQARRDTRVTNLRSEPVELDSGLASLVQLLDGTRDRAELARSAPMASGVEAGLRQLARLALILN